MEVKTVFGVFKAAKWGLWHYHAEKTCGLEQAASDAVAELSKPDGHVPTWFWWEGTPGPILRGDTTSEVLERHRVWRQAFEQGPLAFADCVRAYCEGRLMNKYLREELRSVLKKTTWRGRASRRSSAER